MRRFTWILFFVAYSALPARAELELGGHAFARFTAVEGPRSWRDGGFGRLDLGASESSDEVYALGRAHAALSWTGSTGFSAYLHGAARLEPAEFQGEEVGVVEAFVDYELPGDGWSFRLGHFLLPASRENLDLAWASHYTLTFSALNTWIGEEVRLTGVQGSYHRPMGDLDELRFTAAAFGGNDTAGTLLAWRGWALGDRLTVWDETVPLPSLPGLAPGGAFDVQRDAGTRAFGSDLDGRVGYAGTLRYRRADRGSVILTYYDNRGDRDLHRGEYAWQTTFYLAGADWRFHAPTGGVETAVEWMWGETGMGASDAAHVDADFAAAYALVSWFSERFRITARFDDFETVDRDGSVPDDPNDGSGSAWTLALFYQGLESPWRLGLEFLDLEAERPAATLVPPPAGETSPRLDGRTLSLELRYLF